MHNSKSFAIEPNCLSIETLKLWLGLGNNGHENEKGCLLSTIVGIRDFFQRIDLAFRQKLIWQLPALASPLSQPLA